MLESRAETPVGGYDIGSLGRIFGRKIEVDKRRIVVKTGLPQVYDGRPVRLMGPTQDKRAGRLSATRQGSLLHNAFLPGKKGGHLLLQTPRVV